MGLVYIPKQGDICYINLSPTVGHEQRGLRPSIVISNNECNKFTNMVLVCPITSNTKSFPTHYKLQNTKKISGSVLCEHIRSVDFEARELTFVEKINHTELYSIIDIINSMIEM